MSLRSPEEVNLVKAYWRVRLGHGHVVPANNKARCGGPAFCNECAKDLALWTNAKNAFRDFIIKTSDWNPEHELTRIIKDAQLKRI